MAEHAHAHSNEKAEPASPRVRLLLTLLLVPLIALTVVSTVVVWPAHRQHHSATLGPSTPLVNGTITATGEVACQGDPQAGLCQNLNIDITSGPDKKHSITLSLPEGPGQPVLKNHEKIVLGRSTDVSGTVTYYFSDLQRKGGLLELGLAFAVLVVLIARWRGVGALVGLGITALIVTQFMLPSILDGHSAVAVALTGGAMIVLTVLYVAHGFSARTTTALIGTLLSLATVGVLSELASHLTHITGLSSEEATSVQSFAGTVNLHGLLLGGIIIGSLGVLNDMTVTQASSVWEIHRAHPTQRIRELYSAGMRVGRDHIASTVYTLVLAYTGAALPLLILFTLSDRHFTDVASTDIVGEEIVRALVGGIGLILSVPITTALAAIVVKGQRVPMPAPTFDLPVEDLGSWTPEDDGDDALPEEMPSEIMAPTEVVVEDEVGAVVEHEYDEPPAVDIAIPPKAKKKLRLRRNRSTTIVERKLTRRERKFWEKD